MALRILIDANEIVSAAFGGIPALAVKMAFRDHTIIYSPEIRKELCSLPSRLIHKLSPKQRETLETLLDLLFALAEEVECMPGPSLCRDAKDSMYLWICLTGSVDVLLTGDDDLLSLSAEALETAGLSNLSIIKPRDFLSRYYKENLNL